MVFVPVLEGQDGRPGGNESTALSKEVRVRVEIYPFENEKG